MQSVPTRARSEFVKTIGLAKGLAIPIIGVGAALMFHDLSRLGNTYVEPVENTRGASPMAAGEAPQNGTLDYFLLHYVSRIGDAELPLEQL